jgi:D-arabinose 1-dehydrogenase-like Zn-dependent alcohol dehydrogenase
MKASAVGGEISIVGILAGYEGGVDFMTMFMSRVGFRAVTIGSRRDLEDMCRAMEQHGISPVIDSVYAFDDAKAALRTTARAISSARSSFGTNLLPDSKERGRGMNDRLVSRM